MYLSKIILHKQSVPLQDLSQLFAQGHPGHALAWQVFTDGAERERDFLFRADWDSDQLIVWAVSARKPGDWGGRLEVKSQVYAPSVRAELRLGFKLRVNATVAVSQDRGRGRRHDVVMHAKKLAKQEPEGERLREIDLVQREGLKWLVKQGLTRGFELEEKLLAVDAYHKHSFRKNLESRAEVTFSTLDMEGVLTVTDPARFIDTLFHGLGSAKAYGNGLMLIRPAP